MVVSAGTSEEPEGSREEGGVHPDGPARLADAVSPTDRFPMELASGTEEAGVLAHPSVTLILARLWGGLDFRDELPEQSHHCGCTSRLFFSSRRPCLLAPTFFS